MGRFVLMPRMPARASKLVARFERQFLAYGLILGVALSFELPAATPRDWTARVWEADDGLLDNRVTGLAMSADGLIWVSTAGGVLRFDGVNFEEFHLSDIEGLIGNGARAMFADADNNLWLSAFRESIVRISTKSAGVFTEAEGIPPAALSGIARDRTGTVWLAFGDLVGRLEGNRFVELPPPDGARGDGRVALATDSAGRIWCAYMGRIGLLEGGSFIEKYRWPFFDVVMTGARSGGVWACAGDRIFKLSEETAPVAVASLAASVRTTNLLEDRNGTIWIGTQAHGLIRFDEAGLHDVKVSHPQVTTLLEDREGSIWAGTFGGGLNRLRPRAIELVGLASGLPSSSIASLCQDSFGVFWAATIDGQLVQGDGKTWRAPPPGLLWPGESVSCVAADRKGRLWVGTRAQGLLEFELRTGQRRSWLPTDEPARNYIRSVFLAADDSLWFSTSGRPGGFFSLAGDKLRAIAVPPAVRNIRSIVQDAAGQIWVGTSDGQILKVSADALVKDPGLAGAIATSVRCLHATADGSLWIGYAERAIAHFRNGKYTLFAGKNSLVQDVISQISSDKFGNLWLAGARGLYKLPSSALPEITAGASGQLRPNYFGRTEGLPNLQTHYDNSPSVCQAIDGRLLFATSLGILVVNPANLPANPIAPPVLFKAVAVDDRVLALRDRDLPLRLERSLQLVELTKDNPSVVLGPDHFRLAVQFAALNYAAPENVLYRYRLRGYEEAWSEPSQEGQVQYSRLPAGTYWFEVMASSAAGIWSKAPAVVQLTVRPFYWQTWWFRTAVIGAFTAGVVMLVRLVSFRRLQAKLRHIEQMAALSHERTRIARDIHDDLGGSLAHIKLISENAMHDSGSAEQTEAHLRQITQTTQQVLKSLNETIWAINPGNDTLPHLIDYLGQHTVEFLRVAGIGCEVDLPDNPPEMHLNPDIRHNVFLTVKEALTNVVRHSGATLVSLRVMLQDEALAISIEDNGRGFAPRPAEPHADGLRNMRQRMETLGGSFRIEGLANRGTRIDLVLPLKATA